MDSGANVLLDPNVYRVVQGDNPYATGSAALGRNDFIKLLVTQLENQNPLDPPKDTEFVAQLATFSSLEQLMDLNKRIDAVAQGQAQLVNSQSLNLVGKAILAPGDGRIQLGEDGADRIVYNAPDGTEDVKIDIFDQSGALVRTVDGAAGPGRHSVSWDGHDDSGAQLENGTYAFRVRAIGNDGSEKLLPGMVKLTVDGIHIGEDGLSLICGDRLIPFDQVAEILRADDPPAG